MEKESPALTALWKDALRWGVNLEDVTRLMRERIFLAFFNWLDANKKTIGDKWYKDLYDKGKEAEAACNSIMKIMADSMWMLNMISSLGVAAGLMPNKFDLQDLAPGIDRQSTTRLLALLSSALGLQGLPIDMLKKEIPIISSKKFSLQLYARAEHG